MVAVREMGTTSKQSRIAKARVDENINYNESYGQQDPFFYYQDSTLICMSRDLSVLNQSNNRNLRAEVLRKKRGKC